MSPRQVSFCGSVGRRHIFHGGCCVCCGCSDAQRRNANATEMRNAIARYVDEETQRVVSATLMSLRRREEEAT